tara:strand:- start:770 stop:1279 length:510 start_codon:yes stop_codon:yes gene_type:complete
MKQIIIKGKRNIDGMKGHKKHKRKIVDNISNKQLFKKMSQLEWLNKLYLEENFNGIGFAKKEVERKIKSYKNQDIRKKMFDCEKIISYNDCLEKLVISKLKCYYCRCECFLLYEKVLESKQWTLDRIDNKKGHNKDNVVICCLECNLKKGTINDKKFKFTKQMRIIKTF